MSAETNRGYDVICDIKSPLDQAKLRAPGGPYVRLIVAGKVGNSDWRKLAKCAAKYERIAVVYVVKEGAPLDLRFMSSFPRVHEFCLHGAWYGKATGLEELDNLPEDLEDLTLDANNPKLSLKLVQRLKHLKRLSITGEVADTSVLAGLGNLEALRLDTFTLPDVSVLGGLANLKEIVIHHGGNSDLAILARLATLEVVDLWRIRGLAKLDWLSALPNLQRLDLGALKQVRNIPSLKEQKQLQKIRLDQMKSLASLAGLAEAGGLTDLHLLEMNQLTMEDYRCFTGHPSLKGLTPGFSSKKEREAVAHMLGLPDVSYPLFKRPQEF